MSDLNIKRKISWWWMFPLHQFVGAIGILILANFVMSTVLPVARARWILTETPYFPVQITLGICAGFVLRRLLRHEVMQCAVRAFIRTDARWLSLEGLGFLPRLIDSPQVNPARLCRNQNRRKKLATDEHR